MFIAIGDSLPTAGHRVKHIAYMSHTRSMKVRISGEPFIIMATRDKRQNRCNVSISSEIRYQPDGIWELVQLWTTARIRENSQEWGYFFTDT